MHRFVLRIRNDIFNLAKAEANSRGISINDYLNYCIEGAIAEFMKESADSFINTIKNRAIQKERKRLRNE